MDKFERNYIDGEWVPTTDHYDIVDPNTGEVLIDSGSTTGEIAVGPVGRQLLEKARALATESWTELDKPRNALKAAIEAREAAERNKAR